MPTNPRSCEQIQRSATIHEAGHAIAVLNFGWTLNCLWLMETEYEPPQNASEEDIAWKKLVIEVAGEVCERLEGNVAPNSIDFRHVQKFIATLRQHGWTISDEDILANAKSEAVIILSQYPTSRKIIAAELYERHYCDDTERCLVGSEVKGIIRDEG